MAYGLSDWGRLYPLLLEEKVEADIDHNPVIKEKCAECRKSFVRYASKQRVIYEADLQAEWEEYFEKYLKQRLYKVNVKLWKKIQKQVFERDDYVCAYCRQAGGKLEVDHVIPISRGGTNKLSNLVTSCRHCNRQKHDKTADEYLKWRAEHD